MARTVGWILGTVKQLAKALGISERSARRSVAAGERPGALKQGRSWIVPLTTAEYATGADVSVRTARRRVIAKARRADDIAVQAMMPGLDKRRGPVPHLSGGRMVAPQVWAFQYQGYAYVKFIASGDIIVWYTGIIVSKIRLTWAALHRKIIAEVGLKFGTSPVTILRTGLAYAREAA